MSAKKPLSYQPEYCERLLAFFNVAPFSVTEVQKRDGSISLVETAAELPTFAAFAKMLGTTCAVLSSWEKSTPLSVWPSKKRATCKAISLSKTACAAIILRPLPYLPPKIY